MPLLSSERLQGILADSPMALSQTIKGIVGAYTTVSNRHNSNPLLLVQLSERDTFESRLSQLSIEGIAATVCASFLVSPKRSWWRESICNSISWAILVRMRERQLRVTDQFQSDLCAELAVKLELTCAAVLQELARGGMNHDVIHAGAPTRGLANPGLATRSRLPLLALCLIPPL